MSDICCEIVFYLFDTGFATVMKCLFKTNPTDHCEVTDLFSFAQCKKIDWVAFYKTVSFLCLVSIPIFSEFFLNASDIFNFQSTRFCFVICVSLNVTYYVEFE